MSTPNRVQNARAQRIARARKLVIEARAEMTSAIDWTHEAGGCLPLPSLDLPTDDASVYAFVQSLQDNLTEQAMNLPTVWCNAIDRCEHVTEERGREIHDLLIDWYRMVITLNSMINGTPVFFNITERRKHFVRTLSKVEDSDRCRCGASLDDGEGWDGECGNCADRTVARSRAASGASAEEDGGCE